MSSAGVVIRRARAGEEGLLAGLAARTFVAAYGPANRPEDVATHLERTCSPAYFARRLTEPGGTVFLAEVDGVPAGYVELADTEPLPPAPPDARQLVRFYMEPAWIGAGIAAGLMAEAVAEARERGAAALWLTAWERAPRALAFYRKHGFVEGGATMFLIGDDPQRDIVLVRRLDGGA